MDYKIGTKVFKDWRITRLIGEGANGKVFEIENDNYNIKTKSALKLIRIQKSEADVKLAIAEGMDEVSITEYYKDMISKIVNEIAIMSEVKSHSNIVSYEDHCVIENDNDGYWDILIRMELLTSLTDYLTTHKMSETDVVKLGHDLCNALAFCHKKGLIHRDIKPDNIFVNEEGVFKLGDFGIARSIEKTTADMSKSGTQNYMAPEVYFGRPYGASVDIYSVGIVLYRLMNNNRLPFYPPAPVAIKFVDRANAFNRRMQGTEKMHAPEAAGKRFADIILKACEYYPENRFQSAREMLDEINKLLIMNEAKLISSEVDDEMDETVTIVDNQQVMVNPVMPNVETELEKAWTDFKNHNDTSSILTFKKYAEKGDSEAQLILSELYGEGQGVKQDNEMSKFWLKKSMDNGNVTAKFTYGMKLIAMSGGDEKKIEEGLLCLEQVAEQDNKNAIIHYIETIINGHGNRKNVDKAIEHCQKLLDTAKDSSEIQKYNGYMEALKKALKRVQIKEVKVILATAFTVIGSILLMIGALYVFCGSNRELWSQNELLKALPKVKNNMFIPRNFGIKYLKPFFNKNIMFGMELIFISNILLTAGNVKIRKKFAEIINAGARYVCLGIALLYLGAGIKNRIMTGIETGETFMMSMIVYTVSVIAIYAVGVLVGNCIKKVSEIFDEIINK